MKDTQVRQDSKQETTKERKQESNSMKDMQESKQERK